MQTFAQLVARGDHDSMPEIPPENKRAEELSTVTAMFRRVNLLFPARNVADNRRKLMQPIP
jgi:hypothetical protein